MVKKSCTHTHELMHAKSKWCPCVCCLISTCLRQRDLKSMCGLELWRSLIKGQICVCFSVSSEFHCRVMAGWVNMEAEGHGRFFLPAEEADIPALLFLDNADLYLHEQHMERLTGWGGTVLSPHLISKMTAYMYSVCVWVWLILVGEWVSEWEREGSDKKGTWEAEKPASDAGRHGREEAEILK